MNHRDETLTIDSESQLSYLTVRSAERCRLVCKLTTAQGFTVRHFVAGASTLPIIESLRGEHCFGRRDNKCEGKSRINDINYTVQEMEGEQARKSLESNR